jgi:sulfotransferase family protein
MSDDFRLLMISAMYENGGNTTHRMLDGHPQMYVYPFESQIGTRLVNDALASTFPVKYRWPVFDLDAAPADDYRMIIDEECKVRARTPHVSKFRDAPFDFSDDERCKIYQGLIAKSGRSRGANVAAFFRATFEAWKDCKRTGKEKVYVGYSPIIVVDAEKILKDLPNAHVLHVVRNPWSAYADTRKRPMPLSLHHYMLGWTLNQYHALYFRQIHPDRVHIVRIEDVMADPLKTLGAICEKIGLEKSDTLKSPTWNGNPLKEVYPWGTIRKATPDANRATAMELSEKERSDVRAYAWQYLDTFDYKSFI